MKRFVPLATAFSLLFMLTACSGDEPLRDNDYAYVEITTSTGDAYISYSVHAEYSIGESHRQEFALESPTRLKMADGETATVHFHCDQCGHDEVQEEMVAPYAKLFACDCSGKNNPKEYVAVLVGKNASTDSIAD